MKIITSHPMSNQNNRAVIKGLDDAGILSEFHTAIAAFPGSFLDKLSSIGPFKELSRRQFLSQYQNKTYAAPFYETGRLLASKFGAKNLIKNETGVFSVDSVLRQMDKKVALRIQKNTKSVFDAVYAYEDGAYHSFKVAKEQGVNCLYDLPIGYWRNARRLLKEEQERFPEWASTLRGFKDSEEKLARKDEELAMANHIYVASSFTAKSLNDYSGKLAPVDVIPYGFPIPFEKREYKSIKKKIKLLFVGGLSQRKGIANMFAAVEKLAPHVSLTVVGRKMSNDCNVLDNALSKHNWIPSLPHHKVLELMRAHDVLLFPSLFEGFGLVITEAMSQGTPVITTERTAGPDLIENGKNGWLVKAGSTEELKNCIEGLIQNPDAIIEAGKAAIETAGKRPWDVYGNELAKAIIKNHSV